MRALTGLITGATYVTYALAQIGIAFTSVPTAVVVGQEYAITWAGGDSVTVRKSKLFTLTNGQF